MTRVSGTAYTAVPTQQQRRTGAACCAAASLAATAALQGAPKYQLAHGLKCAHMTCLAGPFGLLCFGMTTDMLMFITTGWVEKVRSWLYSNHFLRCAHDVSLTYVNCMHQLVLTCLQHLCTYSQSFLPTVICYAAFYGGLGQFVAGILEVSTEQAPGASSTHCSTGALSSNQGTASSRPTQPTPCHALSHCAAHQGQHVCRHRLLFLRLFLDGLVPVGIPELQLHRRQAPVRPGDDWQDPLVWPVVSAQLSGFHTFGACL